jgi:hypothetical protein
MKHELRREMLLDYERTWLGAAEDGIATAEAGIEIPTNTTIYLT